MGAISKKTKFKIGKPCKVCSSTEKYTCGSCTFCVRKYAREVIKKFPEKIKERKQKYYKNSSDKIRDYKFITTYNITLQEYNELSEKQKNVCAICKNICTTGKRLSVDHDHKTNNVRGLLCTNCNRGIGNFKDSVKILREAINYLTKNYEQQ